MTIAKTEPILPIPALGPRESARLGRRGAIGPDSGPNGRPCSSIGSGSGEAGIRSIAESTADEVRVTLPMSWTSETEAPAPPDPPFRPAPLDLAARVALALDWSDRRPGHPAATQRSRASPTLVPRTCSIWIPLSDSYPTGTSWSSSGSILPHRSPSAAGSLWGMIALVIRPADVGSKTDAWRDRHSRLRMDRLSSMPPSSSSTHAIEFTHACRPGTRAASARPINCVALASLLFLALAPACFSSLLYLIVASLG